MRGLETSVVKLRRKVFAEVARVALWSENIVGDTEAIPYRITPADRPQYRESIYRERAIAAERVRLAMGMPLRPEDRPVHITSGLSEETIAEAYYGSPLMQVIPSACEKCAVNEYLVGAECTRCLARSCIGACPAGAVSVGEDGRAVIDKEKCIRCGRCKAACPYDAIVHRERPCAKACGVNAITSDALGRAAVDPGKCVGCGQCMVHCPFGAIADKSQIFQLIRAMREGGEFVAEVAPAIVGQFGAASLENIASALGKLGFCETVEVALGADASAMEEAAEYAEKVLSGKEAYLLTSCCTSWRQLAERMGASGHVSSAPTPMISTARMIKRRRPSAKVVFIGPCPAKKLEALDPKARSDVDFVVTFEELSGIFEAKGIDPSACKEERLASAATAAGRGFAVSGGVASAVAACIGRLCPGAEVGIERAESLSECRKMLALAAKGKIGGCLIEGMACPGGCVAGAGVNLPVVRGREAVEELARKTEIKIPLR